MLRTIASIAAAVSLCVATSALTGCGAFNTIATDVTSFSKWPAGRAPATYAFERLPSQQADPRQSQLLEAAARPAVERAGFVAASAAAAPDVTIQLGARVTAVDPSPFDDPFWYGAGPAYRPFWYGRYGRPLGGWGFGYGAGWGPGWRYGYGYDGFPSYQREVAVLIRDKSSSEVLFESRGSSEGTSWDIDRLLPAMFGAALQDFPNGGTGKPHRVQATLGS